MTEDFLAFILSRTLSAFIAHKVDDSLMVLVDSCSLVDQLGKSRYCLGIVVFRIASCFFFDNGNGSR